MVSLFEEYDFDCHIKGILRLSVATATEALRMTKTFFLWVAHFIN